MFRMTHTHAAGLLAVGMIGLGTSAGAATIVSGNVTSDLGPNFFIDDAALGGSDTQINQPGTISFVRDFGSLNVGSGGTEVTITGIGWASPNDLNNNDAQSVDVTITYLGLDGAGGGGDDVLIGSTTDSYTYAGGASEYVWAFDTPMVQTIDGENSFFRVSISPKNATNNGSLRFKGNTAGSWDTVKISVAGTSTAVPEPSSLALIGLGALACVRRRRGQ